MGTQSRARFWKSLTQKSWFLPALFTLAACDLFAVVFPIEGLTLGAVLTNRKRWVRTALAVGSGSTLGCIVLAEITYSNGPWVLSQLTELTQSRAWSWMQAHVNSWGAWAVLVATFTPIPLQVLVVVPALAGMRAPLLYGVIAAGRLTRALVLCWAAAQARKPVSDLLRRFKTANRELRELDR